tara:strand:- start:2012 stop:2266 length:255 start_codon:yes stop_codon:yes gene_type:complete
VAGKLLTMKEASMLLFGTTELAAYRRTVRLVQKHKLTTTKMGRTTYVSKVVLEKEFDLVEEKTGAMSPRIYETEDGVVINLPKR